MAAGPGAGDAEGRGCQPPPDGSSRGRKRSEEQATAPSPETARTPRTHTERHQTTPKGQEVPYEKAAAIDFLENRGILR